MSPTLIACAGQFVELKNDHQALNEDCGHLFICMTVLDSLHLFANACRIFNARKSG